MPKIKTHKTASKRVMVTASGTLRRRKAGQSHKLTKKTAAQKRNNSRIVSVAKADVKRLRRLIAK